MELRAGEGRPRPLFAPSQISAKTVLWALGTALVFVTAIWAIWNAPLALGVTFVSAILAIALDHPVCWLERHRWRRGLAISVVMLALLAFLTGLAFIAVPPLVSQLLSFFSHAPDFMKRLLDSTAYHRLDAYLDMHDQAARLREYLPTIFSQLANRTLHLVGSAVALVGGIVTIFFITLFMLIYGPNLVQLTIREARRHERARYERVLESLYQSLGGYISGLFFLCVAHAIAVSLFLAIIGVPYFLPLGLLAGFSSLVPIVGATIAGITLTVVAFIAGGPWQGVATLSFYLVYQQIENHVLSPFVYRRTVEVNPLLSLLVFLFFTELFGLEGGIIAVPVLATAQIILREFLRVRQAWFLQQKPEDAPESVRDVVHESRPPPAPPPPH